MLPSLRNSLLAAAVALAIGGCAITPKPFTVDEQKAQISLDRTSMFSDQ